MRAFSVAASLLVVCIGGLVLTGWALDVAVLKSVFPGLVAMKANTAVGLILCGVGLALVSWREPRKLLRPWLAAVAAVVIAIGAITLGEYVFGWTPGIDEVLFREGPDTVWTAAPAGWRRSRHSV